MNKISPFTGNMDSIRAISFCSKNPSIRKADDIQRRSRQVFPCLSPSYIDTFYRSTWKNSQRQEYQRAWEILKDINDTLGVIRDNARRPDEIDKETSKKAAPQSDKPNKLGQFLSEFNKMLENIKNRFLPQKQNEENKEELDREELGKEELSSQFEKYYIDILEDVKEKKIANCYECAVATLAALCANGYNHSKIGHLVLEARLREKGKDEYVYGLKYMADHVFVMSTMSQSDESKIVKDCVVLDSWLGFADSWTGAKARYIQTFKDNRLLCAAMSLREKLSDYVKKETQGKKTLQDYDIKWDIFLGFPDEFSFDTAKDFGEKMKEKYEELVL